MRKIYLDNVRYGVVLSVILYHVFYMFNSLGIIRNVVIEGIPQLDVVLYVLYPWFMVCLFAIAGISAKYALQKQTGRQFLKTKVKKILVPSIAGIFVLGWVGGFVTNQYTDMFAGNGDVIPGFVKYLVYCLSGIGPLWFMHELMLAYLVLMLVRKIDRKDTLSLLGEKANLPVLFLLVIAVWGSAQIFNTPLIEVYRNGIYVFVFLLGYYVLSQEKVEEQIRRYAPLFIGIALVLGIVYTVLYWGENYSLMENLKSIPSNLYAWFGTLGVLAMGMRYLDKETAFTRYMREKSFAFYVLHYPLMVLIVFGIDQVIDGPAILYYVLTLLLEVVFLPILTEIIRRIPVVRGLLLGSGKKPAGKASGNCETSDF